MGISKINLGAYQVLDLGAWQNTSVVPIISSGLTLDFFYNDGINNIFYQYT